MHFSLGLFRCNIYRGIVQCESLRKTCWYTIQVALPVGFTNRSTVYGYSLMVLQLHLRTQYWLFVNLNHSSILWNILEGLEMMLSHVTKCIWPNVLSTMPKEITSSAKKMEKKVEKEWKLISQSSLESFESAIAITSTFSLHIQNMTVALWRTVVWAIMFRWSFLCRLILGLG